MKRPVSMRAHQLEQFACFLADHPRFSPILVGEDAVVCGFQVGDCYLQIDEMEMLTTTPAEMRLGSLLTAPTPGDSRQ
jgi:hypothetical protein